MNVQEYSRHEKSTDAGLIKKLRCGIDGRPACSRSYGKYDHILYKFEGVPTELYGGVDRLGGSLGVELALTGVVYRATVSR